MKQIIAWFKDFPIPYWCNHRLLSKSLSKSLSKFLSKFSKYLSKYFFVWASLGWFVLGNLLDDLSSTHLPPGWMESNPYARNSIGQFVLSHGLAYQLGWFIIIVSISTILYRIVRPLSERLGQLLFVALPLYSGYGNYEAVLNNLWIHLGWYISNFQLVIK